MSALAIARLAGPPVIGFAAGALTFYAAEEAIYELIQKERWVMPVLGGLSAAALAMYFAPQLGI